MKNIEPGFSSLAQNPRITDLQYCDFFYKVINRLVEIENGETIEYLKRYFQLAQPKRCFGTEVRDTGFEDPDIRPLMDTLYFRTIQVFRSGLVMSSSVDFHFRNIFRENPNLLHKILKKRALRICSIGGRLPSDLVALVTVLESIAKEADLELDIRVTVLETDKVWQNTCFAVLDCLEPFSKAAWKTHFIPSHLPHLGEPKIAKAISEADIVTMVKFYSEFKDMPVDLSEIMEQINQLIQPGSLLFFLDFSKDNVIEFCGGPLGVLQNSQLVYEELCDLHALDPDAVEKNFHLYRKKIVKPYYSKYLNVFVRVWLKTLPASLSKNFPEENGNYALTHLANKCPNPKTSDEEYKTMLETFAEEYKATFVSSAEECIAKRETSAIEQKVTLVTSVEENKTLAMKKLPANAKEASMSKVKEEEQLILKFESRFGKREKYNPKQNFLSAKSFEAWEKMQTIESEKLGRSKRGNRKFVLCNKENRNILLGQLLGKRKALNSTRRNLIRANVVIGEDYDGINEIKWKKYLTEKRNFSTFKLKVYSFTLDMLNKRLEKFDQIVEGKKRRFIPIEKLIPITELIPNYMKMCTL